VTKLRAYFANGVPGYWIIDGETLAIEEYHATPNGYLRTASVAAGEAFQPRLFPGMTIDLATLVEDAG
jgi:Uma2 family endonuclease